jgi:hydroxymethylglutaryl-CoA lyase
MALPTTVDIIDVGPRDGLQNEKQAVPAAVKIDLIHRLVRAGIRHLEATSFVSPKWVPQMADATDVMSGLERSPGVVYSVLTPNMKGLESALESHPGEVVVFGAASEAFSQKNINCSVAESMERFAPVVEAARAAGVATRGAISCAVGCPYEGDVSAEAVAHVARLMKDIGVERIAVADTIGVGTPRRVQAAMEAALRHYDVAQVSGHFHDTYGQALANTLASLELGIRVFETSVAGLGGCPYAKGATGNVATAHRRATLNLHGQPVCSGSSKCFKRQAMCIDQ